jgi:hypothetical protein
MACTEYSSDLTGGQTFTASGVNQPIANAFDDNVENFWATNNSGDRWANIEFSSAQKINRARFYDYESTGNMFSQVVIKASNTGSFSGEEATIFTSSSGLTWGPYEWKVFDFDNEDSFLFYRLYFTSSDPYPGFLLIPEIEMMECLSEATELEGDTSDISGVSDSVDSFSLTDTIADTAGVADSVDAFNLNDELVEVIGVVDSSERYSEIKKALSDSLGIADSSDGFNYTAWFRANRDRAVIRYYCILTGAADGLSDLTIPISSFQASKRTGESTYLSVVVPGMAYAEQIADRSNGEVVIYMAYLLDGVESLREEILRVELEQINPQEGARSRSITLIGHKTVTYDARAVSIQGCNYKYTSGGSRGFRFPQADPYLNPGDALTVIDTDDALTVDYITYAISARGAKFMEVRE